MKKNVIIAILPIFVAALAMGPLSMRPAVAGAAKPTVTGSTPAVIIDLPGNQVINHGTRAIVQEFTGSRDRVRIILENLAAKPTLLAVNGLPSGSYDVYRNTAAPVAVSDGDLAKGIPVSAPAEAEKLVAALVHLDGNLKAASDALPPAEHGIAARVQQLRRDVSELQFHAKALSSVLVRIQPAGTQVLPETYPAVSLAEVTQRLADINTAYQKLLDMVGGSGVDEVKAKVLPPLKR